MLRGKDARQIARSLGVTQATVMRWARAFLAGGEAGLKKRTLPAFRKKLTGISAKLFPAPVGAWRSMGPSACIGYDGIGRHSGRVNWIEVGIDPSSERAVMYLGTLGGVWRSRNYDVPDPVWEPLTDVLPNVAIEQKPGIQVIGSIGLDPARPGRIYAGTGDHAAPSQGVLFSDDGGSNWLLFGNAEFSGGAGITRIFVDPTDDTSRTVFAVGGRSGGRGLFMSTDGGQTWALRHQGFPVSTAALGDADGLDVKDAVWQIDVSGRLVILAAVVVSPTENNPWLTQESGFYASFDRGASWERMQVGGWVNCATGQEVDPSWMSWTTLATSSPSFGTPVYAAISSMFAPPDSKYPTTRLILNIFKLENTAVGPVWEPKLPTGTQMSTQDGYNMPIATGPDNSIFFGWTEQLLHSRDAGQTWPTMVPGKLPPGAFAPHTDQHCLLFTYAGGDPRLYAANDGGIYWFEQADGRWWPASTDSLRNMECSSATAHPFDSDLMGQRWVSGSTRW